MKKFKNNLLCWLFGHVISNVSIEAAFNAIKQINLTDPIYCQRCEQFRLAKEFPIFKKRWTNESIWISIKRKGSEFLENWKNNMCFPAAIWKDYWGDNAV